MCNHPETVQTQGAEVQLESPQLMVADGSGTGDLHPIEYKFFPVRLDRKAVQAFSDTGDGVVLQRFVWHAVL